MKTYAANLAISVVHIVEGVTKIDKIDLASREERQAENVRKMVLAMVDDIRVVLIKLADRLHNMRTLKHLPEERRQQVAKETLEIYAPLAHRLGMGKVRGELEDLSFRYVDPIGYEQVRTAVEQRRKAGESFLSKTGEDPASRRSKKTALTPRWRAESSGFTASIRNYCGSALPWTRFTICWRSASSPSQ